jgi:hypothetical protein
LLDFVSERNGAVDIYVCASIETEFADVRITTDVPFLSFSPRVALAGGLVSVQGQASGLSAKTLAGYTPSLCLLLVSSLLVSLFLLVWEAVLEFNATIASKPRLPNVKLPSRRH